MVTICRRQINIITRHGMKCKAKGQILPGCAWNTEYGKLNLRRIVKFTIQGDFKNFVFILYDKERYFEIPRLHYNFFSKFQPESERKYLMS